MSVFGRLRVRRRLATGTSIDMASEATSPQDRLPSHQRHETVHGVLDVPTGDNVRDLGGYPTADGGTTLTHRFLRSGSTSQLADDDIAYLQSYGVRRVVDLRSEEECRIHPCRLASVHGVSYLAQPLYARNVREAAGGESMALNTADSDWMCATYLRVFANAPAMRRIFSFMAQARNDDCVLFHCAAGMDRTGVVASILLGLAGVDRAHVVADYTYSFVAPDKVDAIILRGEEVPGTTLAPFVRSMGNAWDRVVARYGDMHGYLRACGVGELSIRRVREHLISAAG